MGVSEGAGVSEVDPDHGWFMGHGLVEHEARTTAQTTADLTGRSISVHRHHIYESCEGHECYVVEPGPEGKGLRR